MTFEREVMGWLCLSIVWLNTGLVCLQALSEFWQRLRIYGNLGPARPGQLGVVEGRFQPAMKADGTPLPGPRLTLLQTARGRGDGKIYLHDRPSESTSSAFTVAVSAEADVDGPRAQEVLVEPGAERVWVWPDARRLARALPCSSVEEFDAFAQKALHARGAPRRLQFDASPGERLYVAGRLSQDGQQLVAGQLGPLRMRDTSEPVAGEVLLVSEQHPRAILRRQMLLIALVLGGVLALLCALTAVTLAPPVFGTVSKLGALGLLVFLLLVQPLGVWLSEQVLPPHRSGYKGIWDRERLVSRGGAVQVITLDDSGNKAASA